MSLRVPIAFAVACVVTMGLFWVMQALVGVEGELKEGGPKPSIEFVRLRKDTTPPTKKREPPKREKPDQPPPPPDITMSKASLEPVEGVASIAPEIDPGNTLGDGIGTGGGADRDIVPLVRMDPEYPMRARQRGIEGWVALEFTVTKIGSVKDIVDVSSEPGNIFDRAAVQAVQKWKYNPKIEDGVAVERHGVKTVLEFKMDK